MTNDRPKNRWVRGGAGSNRGSGWTLEQLTSPRMIRAYRKYLSVYELINASAKTDNEAEGTGFSLEVRKRPMGSVSR